MIRACSRLMELFFFDKYMHGSFRQVFGENTCKSRGSSCTGVLDRFDFELEEMQAPSTVPSETTLDYMSPSSMQIAPVHRQ